MSPPICRQTFQKPLDFSTSSGKQPPLEACYISYSSSITLFVHPLSPLSILQHLPFLESYCSKYLPLFSRSFIVVCYYNESQHSFLHTIVHFSYFFQNLMSVHVLHPHHLFIYLYLILCSLAGTSL